MEETWTTLRRSYTQTAVSYEKTLKPFFKGLYEGTGTHPPPPHARVRCTWTLISLAQTSTASPVPPPAASSPPAVCVPVLLPLLTLMERSATTEGAELWDTNDQGCDIMLRHLEAARGVARNTQSYAQNAERILRGNNGARWLFIVFF